MVDGLLPAFEHYMIRALGTQDITNIMYYYWIVDEMVNKIIRKEP